MTIQEAVNKFGDKLPQIVRKKVKKENITLKDLVGSKIKLKEPDISPFGDAIGKIEEDRDGITVKQLINFWGVSVDTEIKIDENYKISGRIIL